MATPRLDGKSCIVTGAGSGIGRATAILFAREGGRVTVADIDQPAAERVATEIDAQGGDAIVRRVDVSDEAQTGELAADVLSRFGRIDVLVNNAGISGVGDLAETTLELWENVMRVNLRGVF